VVDLSDDGKASIIKPLDDVQLPQWFRPVELLGHQPTHEILQLLSRSGVRESDVSYVIVEVKVLIVDPHRRSLERNVREALPIPWDQFETRRDQRSDRVDINAMLTDGGTGSEDRCRADMHVRGSGLERKK
jgi:hypothetical protein